MTRECHVRFCEGPGGKFPRATRLTVGLVRGTSHNTGLPAPVTSFLSPNPCAVTPFAEKRKWRAVLAGSATRGR